MTAGRARAVASGDEPDPRRLFAQHAEAMCRTVHALTGRRELAEDVVQKVFLELLEGKHRLVDGPGLRAWMFRTTIHRMRHELRSGSRYRARLDRLAEEPAGTVPSPDAESARRDDARRIQECILAIEEERRKVFVLFELEAHSGKEIAEALDIDVNTVWTRLHRARAEFRAAWGER